MSNFVFGKGKILKNLEKRQTNLMDGLMKLHLLHSNTQQAKFAIISLVNLKISFTNHTDRVEDHNEDGKEDDEEKDEDKMEKEMT